MNWGRTMAEQASGPSAPPVPPDTPRSFARRSGFALALITGLFGAAGAWRWARKTLDAGEVAVALHLRPRPLADLRFSDGTGQATSLAAFRGRVVLLNIWATWCAPCREELPTLDNLQAQLGGPGFAVIALSIDQKSESVAQPFLDRIGVTHLRAAADTFGEANDRYAASGVPLVLVIDAQGREIGRRLGRATWDNPATVALLRGLMPAQGTAPARS
jgi:thiol-disulfide isomerase/thioredoxin